MRWLCNLFWMADDLGTGIVAKHKRSLVLLVEFWALPSFTQIFFWTLVVFQGAFTRGQTARYFGFPWCLFLSLRDTAGKSSLFVVKISCSGPSCTKLSSLGHSLLLIFSEDCTRQNTHLAFIPVLGRVRIWWDQSKELVLLGGNSSFEVSSRHVRSDFLAYRDGCHVGIIHHVIFSDLFFNLVLLRSLQINLVIRYFPKIRLMFEKGGLVVKFPLVWDHVHVVELLLGDWNGRRHVFKLALRGLTWLRRILASF